LAEFRAMKEGARTVLLTGASGFIGCPATAALLARGFRVHAVSRNPKPEHDANATWHQADLLDASQRRELIERTQATHLVHLAWHVGHGSFWHAPENDVWRDASLDLFRLFAERGGRRAVFAGSCAEYDWTALGDQPVRETDPCRPATAYGRAKLALLEQTAEIALRRSVSLAWARFFLLFGEQEDPRRLVPSVIDNLLRGQEVMLTSGRQIRDLLETRDAASALAMLADQDSVSGPINVASGRAVSLREVAERIARLCGQPASLLKFGALPNREGEPPYLVADIARLSRETGFAPGAPLESRLGECIAWHRGRAA
jgi:nucleoside-diphosphate-sugar epimerase